jgi:hypothetical protein
MLKEKKLSFHGKITIVTSIVALVISIFTFSREYIFAQHVLRASVIRVEEEAGKLRADILLVNAGKHYETLYKLGFIYSEDLSMGGGSLSKETIGPIVLKPGTATVVQLEANYPDIKELRDSGIIKDPKSGIHLGVIFDIVTPSGELSEKGKLYRFTEMQFNGERRGGNKPRPGDHDKLIDLL